MNRLLKNYIVVTFLTQLLLCRAIAIPAPEKLAEILGYPADQIVVKDITAQERHLIQMPLHSELLKKTILPTGDNILAAYRIEGKIERTLYPIQIYVAKKGNYLTPEFLELMRQADLLPAVQTNQGGRGDFGSLFTGDDRGGAVYWRSKNSIYSANDGS